MADQGAQELTFEEALAAVEKIVHELEEGKVGLADSLQRYEQGVKLLRRCYGLLEGAERTIELITGLDAQGQPIAAPYKDEASLEAHQQGKHRSQRRTWEGRGGQEGGEGPASPHGIDDSRGVM